MCSLLYAYGAGEEFLRAGDDAGAPPGGGFRLKVGLGLRKGLFRVLLRLP